MYKMLTIVIIMSFTLIIIIFPSHTFNSLQNKIKSLELKDHSIYLIQRGTTGKLGNLAKDFNTKNPYASHLGIGFMENNSLKIYHVYIDKNKNNSNLYIESINDFIKPEDLNYLSIWQLKNIDIKSYNHIKQTLVQSEKENINFDFKFEENNNAYYCSEYIVRKLEQSNIKIMSDYKKKVVGMVSQILKKDTLTYFPVDGFESNRKAIRIFEWVK